MASIFRTGIWLVRENGLAKDCMSAKDADGGYSCSAISPAGEDGKDKRGSRGETGEFGKTEEATWHRLRMGVTGFFMALDEVKIDGGVLRWTVFFIMQHALSL